MVADIPIYYFLWEAQRLRYVLRDPKFSGTREFPEITGDYDSWLRRWDKYSVTHCRKTNLSKIHSGCVLVSQKLTNIFSSQNSTVFGSRAQLVPKRGSYYRKWISRKYVNVPESMLKYYANTIGTRAKTRGRSTRTSIHRNLGTR